MITQARPALREAERRADRRQCGGHDRDVQDHDELGHTDDADVSSLRGSVDDPLGPARHDHIATYDDLVRWSLRTGALAPGQAAVLKRSPAAVRKAHALRDVLNDVFSAVATGSHPDWAALRPYAADAVAHSALDEPHRLSWSHATASHAMLWPVAHAAERLLTSPDVHRVKQCAGCPWLFLDRSRNGSRRWCAMNDCGTHEKIRKYVARRAARTRSG